MGAVVVRAETDRRFLIIDGQQRIATLSILGLAIIHVLNNLPVVSNQLENEERAKELRKLYIGEKDPASLTEISKLSLNNVDDGFFKDYLVQLRTPTNIRSLPKSNRLLWECFLYFVRKISGESFAKDGFGLAEMLSEVVARRLMFILITVEDDISAYTVFETLNARGLELTVTDLLKNYLFSRLNAPTDLESAQRRWQRLVGTVRQEKFGEFLRYHYLTKHRQIRSGRLFKIVRDEVKTSADVLELITELEGRSELFDAFGDSNHTYWIDKPEAKPYIRELVLFGVRQMTPLLFAIFERFPLSESVRVMKFVSSVSFRYTIISGLNPNELEPVYHEAAKAVLDGKSTSAKQVFDSLRSIYVVDDKFEADFAQRIISTSGRRKKVAKYILTKIESLISSQDIDFETNPGTIEHILPENPTDEWEESIPRDKWDEATYRLGNLTVLKASDNRDVANKTFAEKSKVYESSEYSMTRAILEMAPEEWTLPLLDKRQQIMAKLAKSIWRSDFS